MTTIREALAELVRAYVQVLETGRDRIIMAGGDCDPVDVMEERDPTLRKARAALAAQPAQEALPEPDQAAVYYCNKCGYYESTGPVHINCHYHAVRIGPWWGEEKMRAALAAQPAQAHPKRMGLDAIRAAIEDRDAMEAKYHDLANEMIYHGNTVSWWHSKATAYRDAVGKVWDELKAAGIVCDGKKTCADGVRELAAQPAQALQHALDQARGALADIHTSADMTLALACKKAGRVYLATGIGSKP